MSTNENNNGRYFQWIKSNLNDSVRIKISKEGLEIFMEKECPIRSDEASICPECFSEELDELFFCANCEVCHKGYEKFVKKLKKQEKDCRSQYEEMWKKNDGWIKVRMIDFVSLLGRKIPTYPHLIKKGHVLDSFDIQILKFGKTATGWEKNFDEKFREGIRSDNGDIITPEVKDFIKTVVISEAQQGEREKIVEELILIEKEKWKDAEHCTCLPYSIVEVAGGEDTPKGKEVIERLRKLTPKEK